MVKMKLRQAEIREGKICLDGKVISNPELLELKFVEYSPPEIPRPTFLIFEEAIKRGAPDRADAYVTNENHKIERLYVRSWSLVAPILYLNCHLNEEKRK